MTRREILGRTLVGAQIVLLVACGGDDDDEDQPRAAPDAPKASAPEAPQAAVPKVSREPVTLRLAATQDGYARAVDDAIERWNAGAVPGAPEDVQLERVRINIGRPRDPLELIKGAQVALSAFLSEQDSAGTPPDLLLVSIFFDIPWVLRSGLVQPIDRYLQQDRSEPSEKFLPPALELVRYQNQTMALPIALEAGVARYKAKQFADAGLPLPEKGWTREAFVAASQKLTEDTDSDGTVDEWGFNPNRYFIDWLPFVLQELDKDILDPHTGTVRLTDPAALRGLQFWDELGRVHGIMPYGATVTADQFDVDFTTLLNGILFFRYVPPSNMLAGQQAPLPAGPRDVTPLSVSQAAAIPFVAPDPALSYETLVPFALDLGSRLLVPPVIAGQQHIEKPSTGYLDLMLPPYDRELVFHLLDTARPSQLASSFSMTFELFERLTLPLARGEMDVVQAAQRGQDWLESNLNEP
ncbi:MAG: extracellular solute-binding protein [Chloroflexota bacterium]|nr:extracellular solute-binding protein [Chloroflexota bacterium]MDE2929486.1 extracellular solute-binding protein [Chloroflexota bacterium]